MGFTIERVPGTAIVIVRGEGEGHVRSIGQRDGEVGAAHRVEAQVFTEEGEALSWLSLPAAGAAHSVNR